MSRRHIFIGPNYPPEAIIRAIQALAVNITCRDFITGNNGGDTPNCYITNLQAQGGNINFTLVCNNPVTGDVIKVSSNSTAVKIMMREGIKLPAFSGGNTQYGISPCCVTLTYTDERYAENLEIKCEAPIYATVSDNKLEIMVDAVLDITATEQDNASEKLGVLSINGLSTKNGGINIRGVGSVSVSVAGKKEGEVDG